MKQPFKFVVVLLCMYLGAACTVAYIAVDHAKADIAAIHDKFVVSDVYMMPALYTPKPDAVAQVSDISPAYQTTLPDHYKDIPRRVPYQEELTVNVSNTTDVPNPSDIVDDLKDSKSWTDLLGVESAIFAFLIVLGGWITPFIPWLKNIDSGVYRILTWAILVIAGGVIIGFGNVWQGAIAYFFSTSLYEVIIRLIVKSPKPTPQ